MPFTSCCQEAEQIDLKKVILYLMHFVGKYFVFQVKVILLHVGVHWRTIHFQLPYWTPSLNKVPNWGLRGEKARMTPWVKCNEMTTNRSDTQHRVQQSPFAPTFRHEDKSILTPPLTKEMHPVPSSVSERRRAVLTCLEFPAAIEWRDRHVHALRSVWKRRSFINA